MLTYDGYILFCKYMDLVYPQDAGNELPSVPHRLHRPSLTQLDLGRNKLTELDDISEFPGDKFRAKSTK